MVSSCQGQIIGLDSGPGWEKWDLIWGSPKLTTVVI